MIYQILYERSGISSAAIAELIPDLFIYENAQKMSLSSNIMHIVRLIMSGIQWR